MTEIEYKKIKETLKDMLKAKSITYANIAEKMEVSEVTIKRFFSQSDHSYSSKIFEICECMEIPFFELVELAKDNTRKHFALNQEQDRYFVKNLGHFAIFRELYRKNTIADIKKRWKLNNNQLFSILIKLEKLQLIEVHEKNKVKIIPQGVMELNKHTKLEVLLRKELTTPFLEQFNGEYDNNSYYHNSEVEMGLETKSQLMAELDELTKKYCSLALRDKNLLPKNKIVSVRWLYCFSEYKTRWESFTV